MLALRNLSRKSSEDLLDVTNKISVLSIPMDDLLKLSLVKYFFRLEPLVY